MARTASAMKTMPQSALEEVAGDILRALRLASQTDTYSLEDYKAMRRDAEQALKDHINADRTH